jgi:hypothetical protein
MWHEYAFAHADEAYSVSDCAFGHVYCFVCVVLEVRT